MIGGIGIWQLLIVFAIVVLLFGTKKLRNIGSDLGGAMKGFRSSMGEAEKVDSNSAELLADDGHEVVVESEAVTTENSRA